MGQQVSDFREGVAELERCAADGRADEALALARRLLEQADARLPADIAHAWAANRLGVFFSNRAFEAEARRACSAAFDLLERSTEREDALLADIHNNLGQLDERGGDLKAAERHLESALSLRPRDDGGANAIKRAFTVDNLGAVLTRGGQLDRAEALHNEALGVLQPLGLRYRAHVATVLGNLGVVYRRRGDFARARATLLRAIDTHLSVGTLESSDARIPLANLIGLLLERGDERQADEMIGWLLRVGGERAGAAEHTTATTLLHLGAAAFHHAQLGLAERITTRAVGLLQEIAGKAAPHTIAALQLLANVHAKKGNYERAEEGLLRVLGMEGVEPKRTAELVIDLGKSASERGPSSYPFAIAMFERAIRLLREHLVADPQLHASALGNLGRMYFLSDDEHRADALYVEALAQGDARALGNEYPWLLYCRALLQYHLAHYDAALEGMQQALRLWSQSLGPAHPHVATTLANMALVQWARGDFVAAQRAFARATTLSAGTFQRTLLVGTEHERLQAAHQHQGDLYKLVSFCFAAGARGAVARATAELLLQRKGCVLDALALTHARIRDELDESSRVRLDRITELRARISEHSLSAQLFGHGANAAELGSLQAEEDRLQAELSHAGALRLGGLAPVTLSEVRAALPEGAVLLEYLRGPQFDPVRTGRGTPWRGDRYSAMLLRRRGEPRWFDLGDAGAIDTAVADLRGLLRDPDSDIATVGAATVELYGRLIAPFESLLKGASLLLVAPDGALNLLPFGVLGSPMLTEGYVICHLTSGRELVRIASAAAPETTALVLVDPDFDAAAEQPSPAAEGAPEALQLEALPRTRDEAHIIESLFARSRVLAGAEATVAALKSMKRPALLHIATHGLFTPVAEGQPVIRNDFLEIGDEMLLMQRASRSAAANPMLHAGLALAGANHSAPRHTTGFITAAELAALDLRGTELAVLSACDTGLGTTPPGGEFAGLRRAFSIAGAAAQVISLWEVDDDATAALMSGFYRRLLAGAGTAAALQQAQHEVRRRPRWAHPSAWAAFVAWGATGPLSERLREAGMGEKV